MRLGKVFLLGLICLFTIGAAPVSMPTPVISDSNTIMYEGELYAYSDQKPFLIPMNEKGKPVDAVQLIYYTTESAESGIMRVRTYDTKKTIGWAVKNKNHYGGIVDTDCDGVFETEVAPNSPIIVYTCYEEADNEAD